MAVFGKTDQLWSTWPPTITYSFLPGPYQGTPEQRAKVGESIQEWTWYAHMTFKQDPDPSFSDVRITFNPQDASWSRIGRDCKQAPSDQATMNLAWVAPTGSITRMERACILHEFGHVLGLLHEHQSPAHGGITVKNVQAALQLYRLEGLIDQQIYDQYISVYKSEDVSNYSQVDTTSIMQYPQPKEITGLDHDIGYNYDLSDLDKAYMVLQYPRAKPHPSAQQWTFDHAFRVAGCPDSVAQQLRQAYANDVDASGNIYPVRIRKILSDWTKSSFANGHPNPA